MFIAVYRCFALYCRWISEEDTGDNWFAKAITNRFICQDSFIVFLPFCTHLASIYVYVCFKNALVVFVNSKILENLEEKNILLGSIKNVYTTIHGSILKNLFGIAIKYEKCSHKDTSTNAMQIHSHNDWTSAVRGDCKDIHEVAWAKEIHKYSFRSKKIQPYKINMNDKISSSSSSSKH